MNGKKLSAPGLVLCLSLLMSSASAYAGGKIFQFDLFGFDYSKLRLRHVKVSKALSSALEKKFGQKTFENEFVEVADNLMSGVCISSGDKKYELFWYNSETEGFYFIVDQTDKNSPCPSGAYKERASEFEGYNVSEITYSAEKFFPVSSHNPEIQFGLSTPEDIIKSLGRPFSKTKDKLAYVLKRDRKKEKNCGEGSPLQAITIGFEFKNKVLHRISMINGISGEC